MKDVAIYGLIDPRNGELRYVGKTRQRIVHRVLAHRCSGKRRAVDAWIAAMREVDLAPECVCIEYVAGLEWLEAEAFWIAYFRSIGCRLLNVAPGGIGGVRRTTQTFAEVLGVERETLHPAYAALAADLERFVPAHRT